MKIFLVLAVIFLQSQFIAPLARSFKNSVLHLKDDENVVLNIDGDEAKFFAIGDWGGVPFFPFRTVVQEGVAVRMTKMAQLYSTQFQLALGDNFYFDGVTNEDDKRFFLTFENVFDSEYLNTPWFLLMGNHDHYGNASAQISYSQKSKRWVMPNYNYTVSIKTMKGTQDLIRILMIDTVLLCGHTDLTDNRPPSFRSRKDQQMSQLYFNDIEDKLRAIAASSVPYLFVAGHFPVWSISAHGPTQCLIDKLRPLLHKYQVSAYLCGHDHNMQHLSDNYLNTTVEHILTGAANLNDNSKAHESDVPEGLLKYFWGLPNEELLHGAIAYFDANPNNMTMSFIKTNGDLLYSKIIYPRKPLKL